MTHKTDKVHPIRSVFLSDTLSLNDIRPLPKPPFSCLSFIEEVFIEEVHRIISLYAKLIFQTYIPRIFSIQFFWKTANIFNVSRETQKVISFQFLLCTLQNRLFRSLLHIHQITNVLLCRRIYPGTILSETSALTLIKYFPCFNVEML